MRGGPAFGLDHEFAGSHERIVPEQHGRGPGVIGVAGEGQLDAGAAGYGIHNAQSPSPRLQHATLLYVQLQESGD
jgi:hypothetical protein